MPKIMQDLIKQYVEAVKKIYGSHAVSYTHLTLPTIA